ncbi:hypothetical protein CEP51_012944 [Fusarium floridanum]|uniref:ABC transporter domain-containing protein n=1 Tax=Fusarium floridanum TaxID=1325733 RepID=A0A428QKG8_9HYPO|nr:hypothetical protein CEP51_012944 [Fusarium floridanum]
MWDLRAVLEGFQTALGAVSFLCLVVMTKFKQAEARRRKRRPFIAVLGIILLVLFADIYILFDSTGWMPGSLPLTAALLYMLAVILQIDHLCPSTDKEKNTEPTWCAYFGSWAAMFVFDMVAIVKLALTSRSWPPDLVCAGVRCCFELILLVLSVRPYIKLPGDWRKWFRNERIRIPDDDDEFPDDDDEFPDDDERIQLPEDDENGTMGTGDSNNQEGGSSGSTEQIKLRQSKFRIFLQWIWPSDAPLTKLRIFASLGLLLANTVLGLFFPRLFSAFVEGLARSYADKEFSPVFQPLWRYLVANIASATIQRLFSLLRNEVKIDRQRLASESIYQHLMGHDASFHLQINPTDTNTAFDDGIKACSTFDFLLLEVLPQIITVIGAEIIILSFFGLQVGLVQGTIVAIDTIFILRKMRVQMPMHDSRTAARQETKRRREGGLKAWLTALFCGQVDREIDDYITLLAKEIWIELKSLYSSFIFSFGSDIVITAGTFLAIGLAIKHGIQTGGTFGPVVMFLSYWWLVQGPLKSFMEIPKKLSEELYTADRLRRLLEIKPKMQYGSAVLQSTEGGIRLNNISFSYTDGSGKVKPVFKSLTLSIRPGETVAFVGPSGVGKSTIFSLITRLFDPVEGTVEIDGQDIRTLQKGELIKHMAFMTQDPYTFDGTMRSNTTYGRDGATDANIHAAARMAAIHDDIMALEKQYDTTVVEGGRNLSGGQKQRVALTRVFLRDASIMLLDEATNAVDAKTASHIKESVKNRKKTTLLIAHHLSSITYADRIIVLEKGEDGCGVIVEEGTHEELKALEGVYAQLWKSNSEEKNIEQIFSGGTPGTGLPNNG